jgi:hypothetical protein
MGGLYITDDPVAEPNKYRMPPLSYVGETGYAVFAADDTNAGGHLPFNLSADGEMLALNDADLHQIDKVIYSPHMTDASQGRSPDGESVIQFFDLPTPGAENVKFTTTITADELVIIDDIWSYDQSKPSSKGGTHQALTTVPGRRERPCCMWKGLPCRLQRIPLLQLVPIRIISVNILPSAAIRRDRHAGLFRGH